MTSEASGSWLRAVSQVIESKGVQLPGIGASKRYVQLGMQAAEHTWATILFDHPVTQYTRPVASCPDVGAAPGADWRAEILAFRGIIVPGADHSLRLESQ